MQNIDPLTGVATAGAAASTASMIGGYAGSTTGTGSRRAYSSMSGRYPRSWHPSPYASDNDETSSEPQFYKEEKKNRISEVTEKEREKIQATEKLRKDMLLQIKKTKASLLALNDEQLQTTTRLTILQNNQLTTELEY